jgi:hypothetical protein
MSAEESSLLAQWWCHGVSALSRAQPLTPQGRQAWLAAALTRLLRWGQAQLRSLSQAEREPQTAEEVLEYAFRIEGRMPGLAADLRAAALRYQASGLSETGTSP